MVARLLVVLCMLSVASPAFADTVVVLGVRSVEGDDELANDLTEQLRGAAKAVQGWSVSSAAVSMSQMSLAHGCDELDAACLSEIAKGLQVERILYGTLRRNSARQNPDFAFSLSLYDAAKGEIARTLDDIIPHDETSFDALTTRAEQLITRISSEHSGGSIVVQANVPDASVIINGQALGTTQEGLLRVPGLEPGSYRVEVGKAGFSSSVSTVLVTDGRETPVNAALSQAVAAQAPGAVEATAEHEGSGGNAQRILGWSLIGLGGASLVGMFVSMLVIQDVNNDPLYGAYKTAVFNGNEVARDTGEGTIYRDSCQAATERGEPFGIDNAQGKGSFDEVVDMCNRAETFEVLQWVFLGTAVAAGTAGTILVLTAPDEWDEASSQTRPTFALRPQFGPRGGHLTATLRF